jgi:hypothetical protein
MPVQSLDLWHQVDNLKSIVRFLSQWIAKEIKLIEEGELGKGNQELIQITKLIVTKKQSIQELEPLKSINVFDKVILADHFFATEICLNVIKVYQLKEIIGQNKKLRIFNLPCYC